MDNAQQQMSPAVRNQLFNQFTRQNFHLVTSKSGSEGQTLQFELPRARALARLVLKVKATLTATHSSNTTYTPDADAPWGFIKRVEVNMNNGFNPIQLSGESLKTYNMSLGSNSVVRNTTNTSGRGGQIVGKTSSSGGTANSIQLVAELPISLNRRDPVGLFILQSNETLCTVNVTLGTKDDLAPASSGYTFAVSAITVTVSEETFTIPDEVKPDISALKYLQDKTETLLQGENVIKLPVGQIYRKLGLIFYDASGARKDIVNGPFEIKFNQASNPYKVDPIDLMNENMNSYGGELPTGEYVFDWTNQGIPNLGGSRDYIDTAGMSELWLTIPTSESGKLLYWYETISMLKAQN